MRSSSPGDSALIAPMSCATANSISSRVFPTPVNTISAGVKPARNATWISPAEFASARLPSARSTRSSASVEFAFSA
jgi:hypothetical protein